MNIQEKSKHWWLQSNQEIHRNLNTDLDRGLNPNEAQKRLEKFGPNQLTDTKKTSSLHLLLDQFSNFIVWILIAAAIIAGILGEWVDSIAIIAIIILNALLGFFHEYRAEKSLAALRKLVNPTSKIMREGKLQTLPSKDIVPGDLVFIEAGDRIPADGRFIQSFGLSTQESALTGESIPIHKTATPLVETSELSIGDKMANRNALVRRLSSIETLGYTTIICTDKTGTLTQNEMTVRSIWVNQTFIDVTGAGYHPEGNFEINHTTIDPHHIPELLTALKIGVLCNSADLHQIHQDSKIWEISGDSTEGALLTVAGKANLFKQDLDRENPLLSEIPFDSERKRMSMVRMRKGAGFMIILQNLCFI